MVTTRSASRSVTPAAPLRSSTPQASIRSSSSKTFVHIPSRVILAWLLISLPLVAWDTGYVLGRPHTMAGGWAHSPLWTPYDLYGRIDHVYGWKAWHEHSGFTGAQSMMNVVETLLYSTYLGTWYFSGAVDHGKLAAGGRVLKGKVAARAVLICFAAAVMTLGKTMLYWMNEYFSSYDNIGHNDLQDLILLWIVPNGAWLVFPGFMIYSLGGEIYK